MLMWLSEQFLPPELSHQSSLKPPGCSHKALARHAPPCLSPSKFPSLQPQVGSPSSGTSNFIFSFITLLPRRNCLLQAHSSSTPAPFQERVQWFIPPKILYSRISCTVLLYPEITASFHTNHALPRLTMGGQSPC